MTRLSLLDNSEVIKWCFEPVTKDSLKTTSNLKALATAKAQEDAWGNKVINGSGGSQWTTRLCQGLVMQALERLGRTNLTASTAMQSSVRNKKYQPDLESDEYVYEVKGRNWTTPGTAGEKILGVPLKYGELPRLYKKPLQIILVAYQEYEAKEAYAFGNLLDPKNQTPELSESLAFYKEKHIEYVAFTDILKELGLQPHQ